MIGLGIKPERPKTQRKKKDENEFAGRCNPIGSGVLRERCILDQDSVTPRRGRNETAGQP